MLTMNDKTRTRLIKNTLTSFPDSRDTLKCLPEQMRTDVIGYIFDAIQDRTWFDIPLDERDKLAPVMLLLGKSRDGDAPSHILDAFDKASEVHDVDMMEALLAFDARAVNYASARDRVTACGPWVRPMLRIYNGGDTSAGAYLRMLLRATPVRLRDALVSNIIRFCDELGFSYSMLREIACGDEDFREILNVQAPTDAPALIGH